MNLDYDLIAAENKRLLSTKNWMEKQNKLMEQKKFLQFKIFTALSTIFIAFIITLFVICLNGCSYLNKALGLKDDNLIEETVEDISLLQTGHKVDLTPSSPEN